MTAYKAILSLLLVGWALAGGEWAQAILLEKIVAVVNAEVVTLLDFEDHLALSSVFRTSPVGGVRETPLDREQALQRLIDHVLLRQEATRTKIARVEESEVLQQLHSLEQQPGRAGSLAQVMRERSLSQSRMQAWLRNQLIVHAFIDRRIRLFVRVSEHDILQYYEQHQMAIAEPLSDAIREQIRRVLLEQQVNARLDPLVKELRRKANLQFPP
jgi:hypothetical protein